MTRAQLADDEWEFTDPYPPIGELAADRRYRPPASVPATGRAADSPQSVPCRAEHGSAGPSAASEPPTPTPSPAAASSSSPPSPPTGASPTAAPAPARPCGRWWAPRGAAGPASSARSPPDRGHRPGGVRPVPDGADPIDGHGRSGARVPPVLSRRWSGTDPSAGRRLGPRLLRVFPFTAAGHLTGGCPGQALRDPRAPGRPTGSGSADTCRAGCARPGAGPLPCGRRRACRRPCSGPRTR